MPSTALPASDLDRETTTIELWLATPQQLFNTLDPSPFHEKDLDRDAEEYIVGTADEFPLTRRVRLTINLPADQMPLAQRLSLGQAIQNYFTARQNESDRRMRFQFREGRVSLAIGVGFLVVCVSIGQLALALPGDTLGRVLQEGLLILGWVAMWRPLQVLLYDWWPIRHHSRLCAKLAAMPVEIRSVETSLS